MRTDATGQATPTAAPKITVAITTTTVVESPPSHSHTTYTYYTEGGNGGVNELILAVHTDEQAWGGEYTVILDNSDESLNALNLKGADIAITWSFVGSSGSKLHPLWVYSQTFESYEGKLALTLHCIDVWGFISMYKTTVGYAAYNQWWQVDEATLLANVKLPNGDPIPTALKNEMLSCYDKTAHEILAAVAAAGSPNVIGVQLPAGESDSIIDVIHPPVTFTDGISVMRQILEMTKCFLIPKRENTTGGEVEGGTLWIKQPTLHGSVFNFSTANTFFMSMQDSAIVTPNDVYVWAYNEDGDDWISGHAIYNPDYMEGDVAAHYMLSSMDTDIRCTEEELDLIAEGILAKVEGSVSQGYIEAPMHCSLELFDCITVTDPRYTTPKVSTGYIMRMVRDYDRGVYKISLQLGGVTSGFVPNGGTTPVGLAEFKPDMKTLPLIPTSIPWETILPKAIQGYWHDLHFTVISPTVVDYNHIKWDAGVIDFYDGSHLHVNANASLEIPAGIQYIYFDASEAVAETISLHITSDFASLLNGANAQYLGMVCMVQRGSVATLQPTILPSYGKEPLITTDMIQMAGFKSWTDPATGITYDAVLHTDFSAGHLLLSACVSDSTHKLVSDTEKGTWNGKPDDMDDIPAGATWGKVYLTQLDSGSLKLSSACVYDTGYDPSTKKRIFMAEPTTPYSLGDIWVSDTTYKRCTTARASGSYQASDWTEVTLESIADGTTYARLKTTDITDGHILLTSNVAADGVWYDEGGVVIDAAHGITIWGDSAAFRCRASKDGADVCWMNTYGEIVAGGGNVKLTSNGIAILGEYIKCQDSSGVGKGTIGYTGSVLQMAASSGVPVIVYSDTGVTLWSSGGDVSLLASDDIILDCDTVDLGLNCSWFNLPTKTSTPSGDHPAGTLVYANVSGTRRLWVCDGSSNWGYIGITF